MTSQYLDSNLNEFYNTTNIELEVNFRDMKIVGKYWKAKKRIKYKNRELDWREWVNLVVLFICDWLRSLERVPQTWVEGKKSLGWVG